jgi:hypothetical protein
MLIALAAFGLLPTIVALTYVSFWLGLLAHRIIR